MLSYAPLCTDVQEFLKLSTELAETVPSIHNTLAEKNLIGHSYGSSGLPSWTGDHGGCSYCC